MASSLRKEIENEIIELYDDMDPTGKNTERMRQFFSTFKDDKAFYRFYRDFFSDVDKNFKCAYEPYDNEVTVHFVEELCKKQGIPLYETLYMPYLDNSDPENPPGTAHPVMVLVYPIKRLKQMVFKKNHTAVSATKRNAETGQVTDADKTARDTDVETYSLIVQNQYNAAREFYGPRADDTGAKFEMMRRIQQDGEVSLEDLPNDPMNKTTMNTIMYYMYGACLTTNFLERSGYVLPTTLKGKEEADTTIKR